MQGNASETTHNGIEKLVESLELITARLLDVTIANNQIASSQTPEMRKLFDKWLECLTGEILRAIDEYQGHVNVAELAKNLGLSSSSALSLLLSLERRGEIDITDINIRKGDGKNREICDCLLF